MIYGLTTLSAQAASPERLNSLVRQYWHIENGLHYRRGKSLHEDALRTSDPGLAQNMATLNNLIVGLVLQQGWRYLLRPDVITVAVWRMPSNSFSAHPADFVKALP